MKNCIERIWKPQPDRLQCKVYLPLLFSGIKYSLQSPCDGSCKSSDHSDRKPESEQRGNGYRLQTQAREFHSVWSRRSLAHTKSPTQRVLGACPLGVKAHHSPPAPRPRMCGAVTHSRTPSSGNTVPHLAQA